MDKDTYDHIKLKYGLHSSWAIWAEEGSTPKSNMEDISVFDDPSILNILNPNIVLVGLNFSVPDVVTKPFQNFHGQGGGAYKLRFAIKNTKLWGSYMTDIIKDFPEKESHNVMKYLNGNKSFVEKNINSFEEELKDIGAVNPLIVAFGNDSFKILNSYFGSKYKMKKVMHYSHFVSKEVFKKNMIEVL